MEDEKFEGRKKSQKKSVPVDASSLLGFQLPEIKEGERPIRRYIPSLTKEEYVHANFKFVVNPKAAYESLISNPERFLDWDTVELVCFNNLKGNMHNQ